MTLGALVYVYFMAGFFVAMMWPIGRDIFSDTRSPHIRRPGETGAAFMGKIFLVALLWPAPVGAVGYYFIAEMVIPWLTKPK